jgi:hypothetical protein
MSRTYHHSRKHAKGPSAQLMFNNWMYATPAWWIRLYMSHPRRHHDVALLLKVVGDVVDADNAAFAVGGRKPHIYYW